MLYLIVQQVQKLNQTKLKKKNNNKKKKNLHLKIVTVFLPIMILILMQYCTTLLICSWVANGRREPGRVVSAQEGITLLV